MKINDDLRRQVLEVYRSAAADGVSLDEVQKKIEHIYNTAQQISQATIFQDTGLKYRLQKMVPAVLVTLGSVLVTNAVWPIISYYLFTKQSFADVNIAAPIPDNEIVIVRNKQTINSGDVAGVSAYEDIKDVQIQPTILVEPLDYTDLSNWFEDLVDVNPSELEEEVEYIIDIPKINIKNAVVKIGGKNLDENLIQYPGTSLPGDLGAPVIFGHSVLRQFYRPQEDNPKRYNSIFSKIMTLKDGDEIFVTYSGARYTYRVVKKYEVKPEDVFILEQQYDSRLLKLVTCVPEGTYLRRGVVVAQLQ